METNVEEELVRRFGLNEAGSGLRPLADFHENGQWSSDGIQVGQLECLSHNQLSNKESGRHNVVANCDSSSIFQSVSVGKEFVFLLMPLSRLFHGKQIKV